MDVSMDWYHVIKTINGQRYVYRQITWREEGRVRTRSQYVGRADVPTTKSAEATCHQTAREPENMADPTPSQRVP
jgi:hypothetical protein